MILPRKNITENITRTKSAIMVIIHAEVIPPMFIQTKPHNTKVITIMEIIITSPFFPFTEPHPSSGVRKSKNKD
jgi:hypothetical protein